MTMNQIAVIIATALTLASCGSSSNNGPINSDLIDRNWELTSYSDAQGSTFSHTNEAEFSFTVLFVVSDEPGGSSKRNMSGEFVCNFFGAGITTDNSVLSVMDVVSTSALCSRETEEPAGIFGRLLLFNEMSTMLSVEGDVLEILSGTNEKLVFTELVE